eukprot:1157471-Pelagomonas_calceolata.AAC.6
MSCVGITEELLEMRGCPPPADSGQPCRPVLFSKEGQELVGDARCVLHLSKEGQGLDGDA